MQKIIVVGAGIGGLTAALALQRAGCEVQIYEQAATLGEVGAGISLSPNATAGLLHLGLENELQLIGTVPASFGIKHYASGALLVDNTQEMTHQNATGAPYYMVHRADLHAMLLAAVTLHDPDCISLHHELLAYTQDGAGIEARFSNGQVAAGDLLIGCDGIKSTVRAQLCGPESPRFTGYICWRGLVPIERINSTDLQPESGICIGPGKTFTRYLLRQRQLINYVAVARRDGWQEEGWTIRSDTRELLEEFAEFHSSMRDIMAATPADRCFKWALFDRDPLPVWSNGRATLLGDAAHPMLPFMGQGAVMAIEDAVVLARCLSDSNSIEIALRRYAAARIERANMVMLESRANIQRLQADPGSYDKQAHKNEQRLGLFDYDPGSVAV